MSKVDERSGPYSYMTDRTRLIAKLIPSPHKPTQHGPQHNTNPSTTQTPAHPNFDEGEMDEQG